MSSKITKEVIMAEHFKQFYRFFQEKTFCDITLVSNEGLKIAAHKIVLASASRVFYKMFIGPLKANEENEIPVKEMDFEVLDIIVKFAYTTKLDIKERTVKKLLIAANLYELSYVKELCSEYINETLSATNCVSSMKTNIDEDSSTHLLKETINLDTKPSCASARNTSVGSNIIFAITGHSSSGDCCVKYMDIRNEDDLKWKSSDCLFFSPPRKETTMVVSENGIILAIGGREESGSVNLVDELDLNSMLKQWVPTTQLHRHRRGFAVCTDKQYIYVVGGYDYSGKDYLDSVEYYDTNSKEWMKIPEPMPTARDSCSATIYNNRFLVDIMVTFLQLWSATILKRNIGKNSILCRLVITTWAYLE
ncbi:kelch-like protein 23 isoform X2 [Adelges cooleyi]|uniref:kelch-like protein 23 isoform X2 n=1 Tax=Adelges cooleyi TaxID=133065 RepID=UPI00217F61BF|nr:kelch-like protein 23 isoform X2 [Adelges cooleyi]